LGPEPLNDLRFERQRRQLIEEIREHGIEDLEILRAFDITPRHIFLPESVQHRAYEDAPLPIGYGQTASQPSLQALYIKTLDLQPSDRVLEIGTGTGFQTVLLARLAAHVYSVERIRELSQRARTAIDALHISNIALLVGDGTIGWSRYAPYDAILVAAGAPDVPPALIDQLAPNGRLLIPLGGRDTQELTLIRKTASGIEQTPITTVVFVPLLGRFGWETGDKL
jgi:protein-L-isoaspartate(D-aspartate) O-methyltransferase